MALYANESRDRVRDAVDFVEVVQAKTELRAAGPNRYVGLCPFHDERTPSFGIDPQQKLYYCFGCGASGDVFTFVSETEGVDFKGALELLADRYGVKLEPQTSDPRTLARMQQRERLLVLLERTAAYYERYLWESAEAAPARSYLIGRGLTEQALRQFRVGYAPSAWDRVLLASRRGGFSERELYDAGLGARNAKTSQVYDRFRERIMFPLADARGRVLGFGARAMRDGQGPKYLNSADNDLYHKGKHLYGAHLARAAAGRAGEVVVCEGYTDVIACHQAGLDNAVGLMGTAMTGQQLQEAARLASRVLLALDADSAGQEAVLRAARLASREESDRKLELRVVRLPAGPDGSGLDPAELIAADGGAAMKNAVAESVPFLRFRVERVLAAGDHASAEGREGMLSQLRPVLGELPDSPMLMEMIQLVAGRLQLRESEIGAILASRPLRASGTPGRQQAGPPTSSTGGMSRRERSERSFLALCIAFPREGKEALAQIDPEQHFTAVLLRRAAEHLRGGHLLDPTAGIDPEDSELAAMVAALAAHAGALAGSPGGDPAPGVGDPIGAAVAAAPQRREPGAADGDVAPHGPTSAMRTQQAAAQIEVQRLQLELARLERAIVAARAHPDARVSDVAVRRAAVKRQFDAAQQHALEVAGSVAG
jgi:DNA primase